MADFFEIDFLNVESSDSGDAIALRYQQAGQSTIHVVDGGFQDTGDKLIELIKKYYGDGPRINAVIATHPDGDHAGGLRAILEELEVDELWMLRPWLYANELLPRFAKYTSVDGLKRALREAYSNFAALEDIAEEQDMPIKEPFQGAQIGAFKVLAPSKGRYLDHIVASDRTPQEAADESKMGKAGLFKEAAAKVVQFFKAAWGEETFSEQGTSAENETSVVQYAKLCGERILLTADAGREALREALDYAPSAGITFPGIERFQVPHHGSRRNVDSELLDDLLGERLREDDRPAEGKEYFSAIISASKEDEDHPRKAVIRAMIHRGGKVVTTENSHVQFQNNAPDRPNYSPITPLEYPEEQESD